MCKHTNQILLPSRRGVSLVEGLYQPFCSPTVSVHWTCLAVRNIVVFAGSGNKKMSVMKRKHAYCSVVGRITNTTICISSHHLRKWRPIGFTIYKSSSTDCLMGYYCLFCRLVIGLLCWNYGMAKYYNQKLWQVWTNVVLKDSQEKLCESQASFVAAYKYIKIC